jgi:hypothetical protein
VTFKDKASCSAEAFMALESVSSPKDTVIKKKIIQKKNRKKKLEICHENTERSVAISEFTITFFKKKYYYFRVPFS